MKIVLLIWLFTAPTNGKPVPHYAATLADEATCAQTAQFLDAAGARPPKPGRPTYGCYSQNEAERLLSECNPNGCGK